MHEARLVRLQAQRHRLVWCVIAGQHAVGRSICDRDPSLAIIFTSNCRESADCVKGEGFHLPELNVKLCQLLDVDNFHFCFESPKYFNPTESSYRFTA